MKANKPPPPSPNLLKKTDVQGNTNAGYLLPARLIILVSVSQGIKKSNCEVPSVSSPTACRTNHFNLFITTFLF